MVENQFIMKERIHKRLPVEFVREVLESFNSQKISEKEATELLGIKRSRLYQLRQRWLRGDKNQPFVLWRRTESVFHVVCPEVKEWLDKELRYIRQQADTFRGKFNFAFLAKEAEKIFGRRFNRNSIRLYALKSGYYNASPSEKGKVYTRFETSGPRALFQHDSSYHLWLLRIRRKQYLIISKNDYSRMVVGSRLVEAESSFEHLQTVRQTISTFGIPLAYYLDNHSIFRFVLRRGFISNIRFGKMKARSSSRGH